MNSELDALKHFFAAINRNDMEAITRDFDPQILRIEPEGLPTAGTYRGSAAVQENVRRGRATWAEGSCEPEKFLIEGDKVVVYLYAWVRLKDATDWTGGRFADGFVFRDGKITEYRTFSERVQALEWAGIQDVATSIAPWLSVPDAAAALEFYSAAFGAVELERLEDDAGHVAVAQLSLDGARFWVQTDFDSSPAALRGISVRMIVTVGDPDQLFERAMAAGATRVSSMHEAHGWRTGRVSDPFGHHWEFSRPLAGPR